MVGRRLTYHTRWGIEETFKFLKRELQLENFHARTPRGIQQEIGVSLILALLAYSAAPPRGRRRKCSPRIANELITQSITCLTSESCIVRNETLSKITQIVSRRTCGNPAGRHFERRSRKVINRWQRSIAFEWDKAQRRARRGQGP